MPFCLFPNLGSGLRREFPNSFVTGILGSREKFAHAGEKAQGSIKTVSNAELVIERVRSQL